MEREALELLDFLELDRALDTDREDEERLGERLTEDLEDELLRERDRADERLEEVRPGLAMVLLDEERLGVLMRRVDVDRCGVDRLLMLDLEREDLTAEEDGLFVVLAGVRTVERRGVLDLTLRLEEREDLDAYFLLADTPLELRAELVFLEDFELLFFTAVEVDLLPLLLDTVEDLFVPGLYFLMSLLVSAVDLLPFLAVVLLDLEADE